MKSERKWVLRALKEEESLCEKCINSFFFFLSLSFFCCFSPSIGQYEATEKKLLETRLGELKLRSQRDKKSRAGEIDFSVTSEERLEIWIRPDGSSSKHTSSLEDQSLSEELNVLTDVNVCDFGLLKQKKKERKHLAVCKITSPLMNGRFLYIYLQSLQFVLQLNKRFVLSFLHVHGKLFSKVG